MRSDSYHLKVAALLKRNGYKTITVGNQFQIVSLGIGRWSDETLQPHKFNSLRGVLDHLIPIIGSDFGDECRRLFPD